TRLHHTAGVAAVTRHRVAVVTGFDGGFDAITAVHDLGFDVVGDRGRGRRPWLHDEIDRLCTSGCIADPGCLVAIGRRGTWLAARTGAVGHDRQDGIERTEVAEEHGVTGVERDLDHHVGERPGAGRTRAACAVDGDGVREVRSDVGASDADGTCTRVDEWIGARVTATREAEARLASAGVARLGGTGVVTTVHGHHVAVVALLVAFDEAIAADGGTTGRRLTSAHPTVLLGTGVIAAVHGRRVAVIALLEP